MTMIMMVMVMVMMMMVVVVKMVIRNMLLTSAIFWPADQPDKKFTCQTAGWIGRVGQVGARHKEGRAVALLSVTRARQSAPCLCVRICLSVSLNQCI